jgi:hypothetical protein
VIIAILRVNNIVMWSIQRKYISDTFSFDMLKNAYNTTQGIGANMVHNIMVLPLTCKVQASVTNNLTVKKLLSWIPVNQFGQGKLS